ncbi:MAG TPA: chitobiase/beta-hexosaminidase C-terminal domain-containing protein [Methanobacterium sp.]|nr:chitobiase/beta-hexosaminidase C-terminal domain-containing protein [Methanobacterium sp.]
MTIQGQSQTGTIIDAQNAGRIFTTNSSVTVNLKNLTLKNGNSGVNGGAINNTYGNTLIVTSCTFINNTATGDGGAIHNDGTLTVTGCKFTGNSAKRGGAIFTDGISTVTGSTFTGNTANKGGAFFNYGGDATSRIFKFNRIVGNNLEGSDIYNDMGTIDATLNWWGSNNSPAERIDINTGNPGTTVLYDPWIVLSITANPSLIAKNGHSTITVDLQHDNNGTVHNPSEGVIPYTGPANFATTIGTISNTNFNSNGIATSTLNGGSSISGTANVYASLDGQPVLASVVVDVKAPTVTANPEEGVYNTSKSVSLKMNEAGTIFYTLNGSTPTTSSSKYTTPLLISSSMTLKFFARDLAGNKSKIYTKTYTIDKTAPKVVSTVPANLKTGVSRTSTIAVKFSENFNASTYWSSIKVKNLTTGKFITINKTISSNMLYINTATKAANTWYQIIIPAKAIKDSAGNNLLATYTFKFKTGN